MKAIRFHQHGGPEVLRYEDAPDPELVSGDVLVRVRACALNHLDLWSRRGLDGVVTPLPHVPGSDVAGDVVASAASEVTIGRRVMVQPGVSCGRCLACLSGQDFRCPHYEVLGCGRTNGGCAELVRVPVANLVPIPDEMDYQRAAAFPLTFLTAWHMLITRAHLQRDDDVLVIAAGSGVGQAAVQVAFLHGARVFATVGSPATAEQARALGAYEVIDHAATDVAEEIRRLTNGRGVDVVIEHVGEATWSRSVRALARGGRLVTCGATTGPTATLDLRAVFGNQLSILGSNMGSKGELLRAARHFFAGQLTPVIDSTWPLERAADAHRRLEASEHFGKIVLEV